MGFCLCALSDPFCPKEDFFFGSRIPSPIWKNDHNADVGLSLCVCSQTLFVWRGLFGSRFLCRNSSQLFVNVFWDHSSTQQTKEQGEKQGTLMASLRISSANHDQGHKLLFFFSMPIYLAQCGKVQSFRSWWQEWLHPWKISDHLKAPSHV